MVWRRSGGPSPASPESRGAATGCRARTLPSPRLRHTEPPSCLRSQSIMSCSRAEWRPFVRPLLSMIHLKPTRLEEGNVFYS